MCEYCELRTNLVFHHDFNGGMDDSVYITDKYSNGPVMVMCKSYGTIELSRVYKEINFCPMCGKELRKLDTPFSLSAARGELEMDAIELVNNLLLYGDKYAGDPEREIQELLDRQADITRQECMGDAEEEIVAKWCLDILERKESKS